MTQLVREIEGMSVDGSSSSFNHAVMLPYGQSLNVIVADDQAIHRTFLSILIEKFGHTAIPVKNGTEALEKVRTNDAPILITDFDMP